MIAEERAEIHQAAGRYATLSINETLGKCEKFVGGSLRCLISIALSSCRLRS
jgi:hypothetical protein